jgi:hypothetical protein
MVVFVASIVSSPCLGLWVNWLYNRSLGVLLLIIFINSLRILRCVILCVVEFCSESICALTFFYGKSLFTLINLFSLHPNPSFSTFLPLSPMFSAPLHSVFLREEEASHGYQPSLACQISLGLGLLPSIEDRQGISFRDKESNGRQQT